MFLINSLMIRFSVEIIDSTSQNGFFVLHFQLKVKVSLSCKFRLLDLIVYSLWLVLYVDQYTIRENDIESMNNDVLRKPVNCFFPRHSSLFSNRNSCNQSYPRVRSTSVENKRCMIDSISYFNVIAN